MLRDLVVANRNNLCRVTFGIRIDCDVDRFNRLRQTRGVASGDKAHDRDITVPTVDFEIAITLGGEEWGGKPGRSCEPVDAAGEVGSGRSLFMRLHQPHLVICTHSLPRSV